MWRALKRLIAANPMGIFLWSIISKWYLMIAVASLIVLYNVARGLEKIGFIDYVTTSTSEVLDTSKAIAQNCTAKLGPNWNNLVTFWNCLGNPGEYKEKEGTGEVQLQEGIEKIMSNDGTVPEPGLGNPYDDDDTQGK